MIAYENYKFKLSDMLEIFNIKFQMNDSKYEMRLSVNETQYDLNDPQKLIIIY